MLKQPVVGLQVLHVWQVSPHRSVALSSLHNERLPPLGAAGGSREAASETSSWPKVAPSNISCGGLGAGSCRVVLVVRSVGGIETA